MTTQTELTMTVDRQSPIPMYFQIQKQLELAIESGLSGLLPAETLIAEQCDVSRFTVRQAIDGLVRQGLVRRERGRGTFIVGQADAEMLTVDVHYSSNGASCGLRSQSSGAFLCYGMTDENAQALLDALGGKMPRGIEPLDGVL